MALKKVEGKMFFIFDENGKKVFDKKEDENMNKVNLIYKLNGDFEDGINVFELAPTLLAIGQLISESQKTLFPDKEPIAINVKPFENGSFDVSIMMFAKSNLQQLLSLIRSQSGKDIADVLAFIGLIIVAGTPPTITLLKLIKWLKGKPKSIEKENTGDYKYIDNSNNSVSVPVQVHALYQNVNIQQTIYNGIAKPLENDKVKNIECSIKNAEETKTLIEKDIIEPLKQYSLGELPSAEKTIEESNLRKIWVHPRRGSWEGEAKSWSFRIAGNEEVLKIDSISDNNFLDQIKNGTIRLAHTDRLLVEVIEKQKLQGKKESTTYEISKIMEYVKSEEQLSIDFDNKE